MTFTQVTERNAAPRSGWLSAKTLAVIDDGDEAGVVAPASVATTRWASATDRGDDRWGPHDEDAACCGFEALRDVGGHDCGGGGSGHVDVLRGKSGRSTS